MPDASEDTREWRLVLVRHGESVANVRATAAERAGAEVIDVTERDADVPLSELGREQADALGGWLVEHETGASAAWSSPYLRAEQTIRLALERAGRDLEITADERLRDRELGILDLLTTVGAESRFPDEAARRRRLGKFFYRPPGGESWADVALRVRSFLTDLERRSTGTVLIAAHDAVVMLFVHVCLGLTEKQLLDFARTNTVANASVTVLTRVAGVWSLDPFSSVEHLELAGTATTEHQGDRDVHPR